MPFLRSLFVVIHFEVVFLSVRQSGNLKKYGLRFLCFQIVKPGHACSMVRFGTITL